MTGFRGFGRLLYSSPLLGDSTALWRCLAITYTLVWFIAHMNVIGAGALETWDESRFPHCLEAARAFTHGDYSRGARFMISGTQGRPGACITWLPHMALHATAQVMGASDEQSLRASLAGNIVWGVVLSVAVFELGICGFQLTPRLAWLACIIFQSFISTSINAKHFYPYDAALAASLVALVWTLRCRAGGELRAFVLGCGASAAFVTYPGYYFVYPMLFSVAVHSTIRGSLRCGLAVFWFIAGAMVPLGFFEVLGQLGGVSLAASLRHLSGTVSLGSYNEMFTFPISYAVRAEGLLGLISLGAIGIALTVAGIRIIKSLQSWLNAQEASQYVGERFRGIDALILSVVLSVFLLHALSGYYLLTFVWYRRLLHLYLPWVSFAVVRTANLVPLKQRSGVLTCIAVVAIVSVYTHVTSLGVISYPRDVLLKMGISGSAVNQELERSDLGCWKTTVDWRYGRDSVATDPSLHTGFMLRNFCSGFMPDHHTSKYGGEKSVEGSVIYSALHYENLAAYQYDGISPQVRAEILRLVPRIEVRSVGTPY